MSKWPSLTVLCKYHWSIFEEHCVLAQCVRYPRFLGTYWWEDVVVLEFSRGCAEAKCVTQRSFLEECSIKRPNVSVFDLSRLIDALKPWSFSNSFSTRHTKWLDTRLVSNMAIRNSIRMNRAPAGRKQSKKVEHLYCNFQNLLFHCHLESGPKLSLDTFP